MKLSLGLITWTVSLCLLPALGFAAETPCPKGDPLCVEKSLEDQAKPSAAPRPKPAKVPAPRPTQQPSAFQAANAERERTASERAQARAASPVTAAPAKIGKGSVQFSDDPLLGARLADDRIDASGGRRPIGIAISCFDTYNAVYTNESASVDQVKRAYARMVQCMRPCTTDADAHFLSSCVDWSIRAKALSGVLDDFELLNTEKSVFSCSERARADATSAGLYAGSDQNEGCAPQDGLSIEMRRFAAEQSTNASKSLACPRDASDYARLSAYAEAVLARGYDIGQLPAPGRTVLSCGYSADRDQVLESKGRFASADLLLDKESAAFPSGCSTFKRVAEASPLFSLQGKSCSGDRSYRERGAIGDARFLPLGNGVWIETHSRSKNGVEKFQYHGLLIQL